jgi:hypothetical protein
MRTRRITSLISMSALVLLIGAGAGHGRGWLAPEDRLDDATFWRMFSEFSEPGGFFPSDNLVSNETTFPMLMPEVARRASPAGAYVGVGPEQNFSYIAALRPRIAFIVDIRRQNAILQLLYKALFEMAPTRAAFLSKLLSREAPPGLHVDASVDRLIAAFATSPASAAAFEANLQEVRTLLTRARGFALDDDDLAALQYIYAAFFAEGPALQYSFGSSRRGRPFPTFAQLMTAADDGGIPRSFLATEASYGAIRDMQRRNLIVPVVGDFAGGLALRSVASYLGKRGFSMRVLYTSNVEQYLFRGEEWRAFYANVARFRVDRDSVLVRSVFNRFNFDRASGGFPGFNGFGAPGPWPFRGGSLHIDPIEPLIAAVARDEIANYQDVVARSKDD